MNIGLPTQANVFFGNDALFSYGHFCEWPSCFVSHIDLLLRKNYILVICMTYGNKKPRCGGLLVVTACVEVHLLAPFLIRNRQSILYFRHNMMGS